MNLISAEKVSHWYRATDQGVQAYYEMRGKNGKMRAPRIDDARELELLVSISRIASMLPKPALEAWKQEQAIISALTLPRELESYEQYYFRYIEGPISSGVDLRALVNWCYQNPPQHTESVDVFAKRVVKDMEKQGKEARDFGSSLHAQIEMELTGQSPDHCSQELEPFMVHVRSWIAENVLTVMGAEQIVGDLHFGIGGKLDLLCSLNMPGNPVAVVDFKTQGVKNGKASFYKDWPIQLAGYAHCVKEKGSYEIWPQLISVVVDSRTPGPVHIMNWGDPESYWEVFLHCLELFCYDSGYRPGKI